MIRWLPRWVDDFQWWLLKVAVRWYVTDKLRFSGDADRWREIYVGINCGAPNGHDERHLAYINRKDFR